jgi:Spy/CpxP family protein refolding chaperone
MKTWIKRTLVGLIGGAVLAGGLAACGHRDHEWSSAPLSADDAAKWRGRLIERAGKELQLDDAQKAKLGLAFDRLREQRNAAVGGIADPRAELRAMIAGERFDRGRAQAWVDKGTDALRGDAPQTIGALADFYDSLRPDQQSRLREWLAKRGHGHWRS